MEKKKKISQDAMITSVVVIAAIISFIGGYVLSSDLKDRLLRVIDQEETQTDGSFVVAGSPLSKGSTLGFDERYVVHDDDNSYNVLFDTYIGSSGYYINLEYGDTKSQLKLTKKSYENDDTEEYIVNFPANVVDVHISTFDLDPSLNTIFVLLEDGDVDYILIEQSIASGNYEAKGPLELEKVTKFYEGTKCERETDYCVKTAFAQTSDGKIYDLYDYVK